MSHGAKRVRLEACTVPVGEDTLPYEFFLKSVPDPLILTCDFGANHVESNRRNYLLDATGDREQLIALAKKLIPDATEVTLPNGVLLFLRLGDRRY